MRRNLVVLILGVLIGAVVAGTSAFGIGTKTPAKKSASVTTTTISAVRAHRRAMRASIEQLEATRRTDRRALNAAIVSLKSRVHDRHATIKAMIAALENANQSDRATVRSDLVQRDGQAHALDARISALKTAIAAAHVRTTSPKLPRIHGGP